MDAPCHLVWQEHQITWAAKLTLEKEQSSFSGGSLDGIPLGMADPSANECDVLGVSLPFRV